MAKGLISWSDNYSVGSKVIDDQHKELIKLTNEFYEGCQVGGVIEKVSFFNTVQGAINYIKTHFATEEEILRKVEYPALDAHKKMHEEFIFKVVEQVRAFEQEDRPNPIDFIKFLMEWIMKHIANADKLYMPYLAKLN
ncbi:MAG: bacteriohemerythrin [Treponema sp.]|jgi:hemerythrin|nr:bacteriohemerythrin [Treponema sp.]